MKKTLFTYLLFLLTLTAFSKNPSKPYHFAAPDFNSFLPFSNAELQTFQQKGVRRIEKSTANMRTIYYFNEQGQLTAEEEVLIKTKKVRKVSATSYTYNAKGKLIVKQTKAVNYMYYDSLAYDDNGRVTHYYAYSKPLKGKKKDRVKAEYSLQLFTSDEHKVVLVDSSQNATRYCTLNNANEVVFMRTPNRCDSVSITPEEGTAFTKKYWYKMKGDSVYRLGQQSTYTKGLMQTNTVWDMVSDGKIVQAKTYYIYDRLNRLLRKENENRYQPKYFYTYFDFGLPMQEIVVTSSATAVAEYTYYLAQN